MFVLEHPAGSAVVERTARDGPDYDVDRSPSAIHIVEEHLFLRFSRYERGGKHQRGNRESAYDEGSLSRASSEIPKSDTKYCRENIYSPRLLRRFTAFLPPLSGESTIRPSIISTSRPASSAIR